MNEFYLSSSVEVDGGRRPVVLAVVPPPPLLLRPTVTRDGPDDAAHVRRYAEVQDLQFLAGIFKLKVSTLLSYSP